jgi:hypothetical protein
MAWDNTACCVVAKLRLVPFTIFIELYFFVLPFFQILKVRNMKIQATVFCNTPIEGYFKIIEQDILEN